MDTSELRAWFADNLLTLLVAIGLLGLVYAYSKRIVSWLVRRILKATAKNMDDSGVQATELAKRATTLESLVLAVLRLTLIALGLVIFVGLTGMWSLLIIVGLFVVGVLIAGQALVMDYLMGVVLVMEGQFFHGDDIELADPDWKGTVEDLGLRRVRIRADDGTVYNISNGELRMVANRTRIFAAAEVQVSGIRQSDLRAVGGIINRVGQELAADPEFAPTIMEAPALREIEDPNEWGYMALVRGKVVASERWRVATELRLRLNDALVDEGIDLRTEGD